MTGYEKDFINFNEESDITSLGKRALEVWLEEFESKIVKSKFGDGYRKTLDVRDFDDTLGS